MSDFVSPAVLVMNIIRHIGDRVSELGTSIPQLTEGAGIANGSNDKLVSEIIEELQERGLIRIGNAIRAFESSAFMDVNLTLDGWERYEAEQRGNFSGNYGFIAMKFGDSSLDLFVSDVVKPALRRSVRGLHTMLHSPRAVAAA